MLRAQQFKYRNKQKKSVTEGCWICRERWGTTVCMTEQAAWQPGHLLNGTWPTENIHLEYEYKIITEQTHIRKKKNYLKINVSVQIRLLCLWRDLYIFYFTVRWTFPCERSWIKSHSHNSFSHRNTLMLFGTCRAAYFHVHLGSRSHPQPQWHPQMSSSDPIINKKNHTQ